MCDTSKSNNKPRPEWFSYEKCFKSLFDKDVDITVLFDGEVPGDHFVKNYDVKIVEIEAGSQQSSFVKMMEYIKGLNIPNNDIIYLVEDDYLHKPGFPKILMEGFQTNADYVSLYDHCDKYIPGYYEQFAKGFPVQIVPSPSIHWRTTPSACMTYAVKKATFTRDYDIYYKYSTGEYIKKPFYDHEMFCELWNSGKSLISCIPAYSTHCDFEGIAPVVNWAAIT